MTRSYSPPRVYQPTLWTISSHDMTNLDRVGVTTTTNAITWVSGLGVYVPFVVDVPSVVYSWFLFNGTLTTAHNLDFGVYNLDFTKVGSIGSTAGGTTASVLNTTDGADITLVPGSYYMAFADDSTRAFTGSNDAAGIYQAQGLMEQTGLSSTLPSPAVPVAYTRAFLPHFGMNLRTVAV